MILLIAKPNPFGPVPSPAKAESKPKWKIGERIQSDWDRMKFKRVPGGRPVILKLVKLAVSDMWSGLVALPLSEERVLGRMEVDSGATIRRMIEGRAESRGGAGTSVSAFIARQQSSSRGPGRSCRELSDPKRVDPNLQRIAFSRAF